MTRARKLSLPLAVLTIAVLLAGCEASVSTGGDDLNSGEAEQLIEKQYPSQNAGLKLTTIDCGTTEAKVGNTFTCTATNTVGVTLDIEGTIDSLDGDTDKAHFTTKTVKAVSDGTFFADRLRGALQNKGLPVDSVTCPETLVKTGTKSECDLTLKNGSKQTAVITLTNNEGDFDFDTSPAKPTGE